MNKREALELSIRKWTDLAAGVRPDSMECGFCLYFDDSRELAQEMLQHIEILGEEWC